MNQAIFFQLIRYGIIGGVAFLLDVGLFFLLRFIGVDLITANIISRFFGAITAFVFNYYWTFALTRKNTLWIHSALRYMALWVIATIFSTALLSWTIELGVNEKFGKVIVEITIMVLNFLISRYWVFH